MFLRVITQPGASPAWNMAMDEALFDSACQSNISILRLYRWRKPGVTIGFTQWRSPQLWPAAAPVPVVRRITGGRGILHGNDVTMSLSLPADLLAALAVPMTPVTIYRWLTPAFVGAFTQLEVCATTGGHTARAAGARADCFATATAGDLVDQKSGTKLLGAAIRIRRGGALIQTSIPYRRESVEMSALRSQILGVRPIPEPALDCSYEELSYALQRGISRLMEKPCEPDAANPDEAQHAKQLAAIYASPEWNRLGHREADTG